MKERMKETWFTKIKEFVKISVPFGPNPLTVNGGKVLLGQLPGIEISKMRETGQNDGTIAINLNHIAQVHGLLVQGLHRNLFQHAPLSRRRRRRLLIVTKRRSQESRVRCCRLEEGRLKGKGVGRGSRKDQEYQRSKHRALLVVSVRY
jgi:hypothetical protein